MQILKDFQLGIFRVVLIKLSLYRYGLKKRRGKKHGYIVYTMMGKNHFDEYLHSFGYRIKKFKVAHRLFNEISAHIKTADQTSKNVVPLWKSLSPIKDKECLNKDYLPGWGDILSATNLIHF